jgi:1-deoxy-D-xylulose-5-phosphate synthase
MTIMAPKDENELQHMLATAVAHDGPSSIRYPRGNGYGVPLDQFLTPLPMGKGELLRKGGGGAIIAVGTMVRPALEAANLLAAEGIELTVVNGRFIKPLDSQLILELAAMVPFMVTVEENALMGGFGSAVLELLQEAGVSGLPVTRLGFPDSYLEQGEQEELRHLYGLDAEGIASTIRSLVATPRRVARVRDGG